jgi:hypothetical protein
MPPVLFINGTSELDKILDSSTFSFKSSHDIFNHKLYLISQLLICAYCSFIILYAGICQEMQKVSNVSIGFRLNKNHQRTDLKKAGSPFQNSIY